jgi:cytoplasmic iron level regulating protein YaaA (DUF328/UPF0246 family)
MIILLSPAKSLDYETKFNLENSTIPTFNDEALLLIKNLKKFDNNAIAKLMSISLKLGELNFLRIKNFKENPSRQAILAYDGDVYDSLDKKNYQICDFNFAQDHIRIISGLYGILRPFDLIKPYRLEMAINFKNCNFIVENLYEFWKEKITNYLANEKSQTIVNLASQEYFGAIDLKKINKKIINITFKENKNNILKVIGINSKKARGSMTNFAIINKIKNHNQLKEFKEEGYNFNLKLSDENNWIFIR